MGPDVKSPALSNKFDYSKVKLLIGLPTRGTASIDFASSLAMTVSMLTALKVETSIHKLESSCFVDVARNRLIASFMESDNTHLLMIDDDMSWNMEAVAKMLAHDVDFIAGAGPLKGEAEQYAGLIYRELNGTPKVKNGLISAQYVGGAFMLLKREVIEKMISLFPDFKCMWIHPICGYRFFENVYSYTFHQTEDFTFCERWRETGGEIWIYPNIDFTHDGHKTWKGNFHKWLMALPKPEQSEEELEKELKKRFNTYTNNLRLEAAKDAQANPVYLDVIEKSINNLEMNGVGQ